MTTIQQLLTKIKSAIHGRDVRDSIHDAIKQCYDDATGNPSSIAAYSEKVEGLYNSLDSSNNPNITISKVDDVTNFKDAIDVISGNICSNGIHAAVSISTVDILNKSQTIDILIAALPKVLEPLNYTSKSIEGTNYILYVKTNDDGIPELRITGDGAYANYGDSILNFSYPLKKIIVNGLTT